MDRAEAANVAGNRHIVGRVGEHHLGPGVAEQLLIGLKLGGIAADQAVAADLPDITLAADRRPSRDLNDSICGILTVRRNRQLANKQINFGQIKAGHRYVEFDFELSEILQLKTEQSAIPAGIFGEPIIGNHISANLSLAHGRQSHGRDLIQADGFGGFDAAVASNDAVSVIDQDRVSKTEPPDGIGDLDNLLLGVGTGISRAGLQVSQGLINNGK